MSERKVQTSFRLTKEEDKRYKDLAEKKNLTFNQLVREVLASAHANPDFMNPTQPPKEFDLIRKKIVETQKKFLANYEIKNEKIDQRLTNLEKKVDLLLKNQNITIPTKDESGRRIFDE